MLFLNSRRTSSTNSLPTFFLVLLFLPLTNAASCATVLLQTIATRWDSLSGAYQTEICARGCRPVMATWDEWTYTHAFVPLIDTMAREMSLSDNFKSTFTRIGEDIAKATKQQCNGLLAPGQHFCTSGNTAEGDKLGQWNNCFKKQAAKVASSNMLTMFRLVAGEICKGDAYKYLSEDKLWKEVLPQYMRKYADTCQYNNELEKKEATEKTDRVVLQSESGGEKKVKDEL